MWQQCYKKVASEARLEDSGVCGTSVLLMMCGTFFYWAALLTFFMAARILLQRRDFVSRRDGFKANLQKKVGRPSIQDGVSSRPPSRFQREQGSRTLPAGYVRGFTVRD